MSDKKCTDCGTWYPEFDEDGDPTPKYCWDCGGGYLERAEEAEEKVRELEEFKAIAEGVMNTAQIHTVDLNIKWNRKKQEKGE